MILSPTRNDYIGDMSLWLDVSYGVGFDEAKPLLDAALYISSSLSHVTNDFLTVKLSHVEKPK